MLCCLMQKNRSLLWAGSGFFIPTDTKHYSFMRSMGAKILMPIFEFLKKILQ